MEDRIGFAGSLKNMFIGVVKPEAYMRSGLRGKVWPAIVVVFCMSILLNLLVCWLPYNRLFGGGRLADRVDEAVGDFSLTDDGFYYDGRYQWGDEENLSYILVDTSIKDSQSGEIEALKKENIYKTIMVVTSKEIVIIGNGRTSRLRASDLYSSLNEVYHRKSFGKQNILDIINKWDTPVLVAYYIGCVIGGVLKTFWISFIIAIVGLIIASALKLKVALGTVYKAALYIRSIWYPAMMLVATYVWPAKRTLMTLTLVICAAYMFMAIYRYNSEYPGELDGNTKIMQADTEL